MATTSLYPAPRDLTDAHNSLPTSYGIMKTPNYSYGWPEGQPAEADQLSQAKSDTKI